ncbi:serine-rich adhesin for platelets isoform X2 [Armigeres subalbatus]|uniref:serine-rich adhesin for platelets isoform X2 n=1 Tax=Armigeres subalbatus TaxID=124917 RepID=UPI002ED5A235
MSIEPSNVAQTTATTIQTATTTTTTTATTLPSIGAEEEEESTLVEISASSSSSPTTVSSLSPSSRAGSTGTGDDAPESHPEDPTGVDGKSATTASTTTKAMTISREDVAASLDSSEASTVALVADLTPEQIHRQQQQQQPTLAPVAAQVATDTPVEQQRNLFPIQSSSSLSTPSSSEEYDEPVNTSSTEGALNVSSSNNQLNNNNSTTAIVNNTNNSSIEQREAAGELSSIESALPHVPSGSTPILVTSTPENSPCSKSEEQRPAPIEIVQIFPSTAKTLSSTITFSSSSSSPSSVSASSSSSSSSGPSSASSTSSSPSVSPLAVDQQPQSTATTAAAAASSEATAAAPEPRAEVVPPMAKMDDTIGGSEPEIEVKFDQEVPQSVAEVSKTAATLMYHNRDSSSSPQLQSSLKKYKMGERSSESGRRVSFPQDAQLITGYLEPIDPWACVTVISVAELIDLYKTSCRKHYTEPLPIITEHLNKLDLAANQRVPSLSLKDQNLSHGSCEALEEIFKRVQYRSINLSNAGLDDTSASVLFDMIEYYEAANELDVSDNLAMTNKSWLAAINMVKKSQALNVLIARGPELSDHHATDLAKALNTSALHTLRLEHCELSQRPLASLCNLLKRNTVLRELSLAHNQLTCDDAKNIAGLLRSNYYIQLLDISNNKIGDKGVEYIVSALIEQSIYFKTMQETKRKSEFSFADLSSSLQNINSNKNYFPNPYGKTSQQRLCHSVKHTHAKQQQDQPKLPESSLSGAMSPTPLAMVAKEIPKTPPPTPALPVRTPSGEGLHMVTSLSPPVETQEEEPPPSPPSAKTAVAATTALEESSDLQEKSTNNDSGLNSSVSSEAEQTNSDSSGSIVVSTEVQNTQKSSSCLEEHSVGLVGVTTALDGVGDSETPSDISGDNLVDSGLVVCDQADNSRTDRASDVDGPGEGVGEKQTIELSFDLGVDEVDVKGPKKARLAKQDSILSEFESSMPELRLKTDIPKKNSTGNRTEEPMEEDTPEICADYDDSNLKIVEENLLVDRSINATNSEHKDTKEPADKPNLTDNDDSAPVTPLATHKKDELQLLLEKAKQQEEQEASSEPPPLLQSTIPIIEPISTGPSVEVTTSISVPENLGTIPLKIVKTEVKDKPLSRSLDSAGSADYDSPFLGGNQAPVFPNERSFSSESLNSETSVDSNDSKSSLKIIESKFAARNGTLERQQSSVNREVPPPDQSANSPCGLQVLVLWNNEITRNAAQTFSDLIENTSTLEILNVGCNLLCNDFVASIKSSLKSNSSVTSLGLQGAHLSDNGAKVMGDVIEFGGNATLQRIDMRNNNILAAGLEHLNEAMKSNKTVTRIDLDDVPRRMTGSSLDIGPEYTRLLNNIRAQCERNKNPPEQSEPISTSMKRLRASHFSSRKISLTCPSIRAPPTGTTVGEKHHHHLLDPNKKTGGRLRSPLPSPIPSPIASPVPSPSRNRFQVTRVGESTGSTSSLTSINNTSNTSTSPSPSSTGSSPTLFFAANSRFRVVTVEEPASSSSSVPNYPLGKLSSSSISPSPLVTSGISRMPPSSSSSAPALSSFVSSPKLTSSPILQSVATNTPLPPVLVQHQQLLQQAPLVLSQLPSHPQQTQFPPSLPATPASVPPTPKSKHTRLPSTSSTLNDSVISSTSIESPDLEVKRFMSGAAGSYPSTGHTRTHSSTMDDSCCSSISSSIDSIDNAHFRNTSISSTDESFDLIVTSPSSSSISIGSVSTAPLVKSTSSQQGDITLIPQKQQQQQQQQQQHQQKPQPQSLIPTIKEPPSILVNANLLKVKNNSLSSLEMSTSSQESLYDVQDLSSVSVSSCSGGSSSLVGGVVAARLTAHPASSCGNSNENTLTSIQSLEKDAKPAGAGKSSEKPPRVRKTSWIPSIGNHPKADSGSTALSGGNSGYSPAIEKLMSIFHNPFSSSKSSPPSSECGTVTTGGGSSTAAKENTSSSQPPSRKESPMGGLFGWATKSAKDEDKVLKVNVSPENTITPQVHAVSHSQQSPQLPAFSVDSMPSQLKAEIKENISPENTINNKLLVNPPPSSQAITTPVGAAVPAPIATAAGSPHPKVIFHLGGDYEDSEDDIDTLTNKYGGGGGGSVGTGLNPPLSTSILGTSAGSTTTNSSGISISSNMADGSPIPPPSGGSIGILQTSHLGQLARDSLTTMFKNSSLTSQDSIRSMDSLAEMTETQIASRPHQHHQQQQPRPDDTHQAQ